MDHDLSRTVGTHRNIALALLSYSTRVQQLPKASGDASAGDRVKSGGVPVSLPEQESPFLSREAVAASVAALGERDK